MRVLVAGASGAIGRPLIRQLVAAGHEVTGMTRRPERAEQIRAAGASGVVFDVFDAAALQAAVRAAAPELVINQLTSLPQRYDPRRASFFEATDRVRSEGGRNLIEAAQVAGARRFLTQSISFLYAPEGGWVKDEEARPFAEAPGHFGPSVRVLLDHERKVVESPDFDGLVLRYGQFYGPGTYFAREGHVGRDVRRRFPIAGPGTGMFSFVHVEDAAGVTVAASALGTRGASNAKAKRELAWQPRYASWAPGLP